MALLEVNQLTKNYARHSGWRGARQEKCVVDRVSFSIARGETLGLVGESGSGKSVAMLALRGLLPFTASVTADRMAFDGQDLMTMSAAARRQIHVDIAIFGC